MKKELVFWGIDTKKHLQGGMVSSSRCKVYFERTVHTSSFLNENQWELKNNEGVDAIILFDNFYPYLSSIFSYVLC